jgi:hypothetical protein
MYMCDAMNGKRAVPLDRRRRSCPVRTTVICRSALAFANGPSPLPRLVSSAPKPSPTSGYRNPRSNLYHLRTTHTPRLRISYSYAFTLTPTPRRRDSQRGCSAQMPMVRFTTFGASEARASERFEVRSYMVVTRASEGAGTLRESLRCRHRLSITMKG